MANDVPKYDFAQASRCVPECHVDGSCNCPDELPFRFVVGSNKTVMFIHPSRITSSVSLVLHNLINSNMMEGSERSTDLPDDDPDTFQEFRHLVCTGKYSTGETPKESNLGKYTVFYTEFHGLNVAFCRSCECSLDLRGPSRQFFPHCSNECRHAATDRDPNDPLSRASRHFCAGCQTELGDRGGYRDWMDALCESCEMRQSQDIFLKNPVQGSAVSNSSQGRLVPQTSNISINLMHHVHVSVFGDKYFAEDLTAVALWRLHQELRAIRALGSNMIEVLELIRYVYENTMAPGESDSPTAKLTLRYLVSRFVHHHKKELMASAEFLAMMLENDELADECR